MSNLIPTELTELGLEEPVRPLTGFGFLGYDIDLVNEMTIEPSAMFKFNTNSERQLDLNLKFMQITKTLVLLDPDKKRKSKSKLLTFRNSELSMQML